MALPLTPDSHPLANVYARLREIVNNLNGTSGTVTMGAGVAPSGGDGIRLVVRGGTVFLAVRLGVTSGKAAGSTLFTINEPALRPANSEHPAPVFASPGPTAGIVTSAGVFKLPFAALVNGDGVLFSTSWDLK